MIDTFTSDRLILEAQNILGRGPELLTVTESQKFSSSLATLVLVPIAKGYTEAKKSAQEYADAQVKTLSKETGSNASITGSGKVDLSFGVSGSSPMLTLEYTIYVEIGKDAPKEKISAVEKTPAHKEAIFRRYDSNRGVYILTFEYKNNF